jgi:hypothetical protein
MRTDGHQRNRTSAKHAEVEIQLSVVRLPEAARPDQTFGRLMLGEQVSRQQIVNAADRAAQDAIYRRAATARRLQAFS